LDEQNVDYKKPYSSLTDREYWKIRYVFLEYNPKIKAMIPNEEVLWENEKLLIDQIRQVLSTETVKDASIIFKLIVIALIGCAIYFPANLILENLTEFENYINNVQV
jgi:hypothetical protein